jgi:hypothetical protein
MCLRTLLGVSRASAEPERPIRAVRPTLWSQGLPGGDGGAVERTGAVDPSVFGVGVELWTGPELWSPVYSCAGSGRVEPLQLDQSSFLTQNSRGLVY